MNAMAEDLHNLLAAMVEQAKALASRLGGDPERMAPCHFCGGPLALWENLLVLQLAGVPAHVDCPEDILAAHLADVGPETEFPYTEFSLAVDHRAKANTQLNPCSGLIEC